MAWNTCPWCAKRLNSYTAVQKHKQAQHPREYELACARSNVTCREGYIQNTEQDLTDYRELTAYLAGTGPAGNGVRRAAKIRRKAIKQTYRYYNEGTEVRLEHQLAIERDSLAKYQAALAALEQQDAKETA